MVSQREHSEGDQLKRPRRNSKRSVNAKSGPSQKTSLIVAGVAASLVLLAVGGIVLYLGAKNKTGAGIGSSGQTLSSRPPVIKGQEEAMDFISDLERGWLDKAAARTTQGFRTRHSTKYLADLAAHPVLKNPDRQQVDPPRSSLSSKVFR